MLSDESSSDSETGRFKCRSKTQDEQKKSTNENRNTSRFSGRSRPSENDRFRRELDKRRDERDHYDRRSRDRQRYTRHSPIRQARRRPSRERSPSRRSRDRERLRVEERERPRVEERERPRAEEKERPRVEERERSKPKDHRSDSRERRRHSRSKHRSPEPRKDIRDEIKKSKSDKDNVPSREKSTDKFDRRAREKSSSSSPEFKGKRSAVHVPPPVEVQKKKTESPVVVEEHVESEVEVQPGSYYNMIPTVIKDKSEDSSEIDSSDDEKLRAKLLNSERESHKTRKKKQKKKHKRKSSKSSKERDREPATMEVTSTTDIDKAVEETQPQAVEVTSTQKTVQKESSEEGEILSDDDDSQPPVDIDPTDLRHKLKRSKVKTDADNRDGPGPCGPALPPHLARNSHRSSSQEIEGPALPPHLQRQSGSIGPSIPDDMRKVLAERDTHIVYESSDEDEGIGPIPASSEKWSEAHQRLEERALDMKIRRLDGHSLHKSDTRSREQWMLELPEGKAKYLGLEARSFRAREGPDMSDRSSWTDTPEEKARKAAGVAREEDADAALQREARARHIASRDEEQEHAVKKHKKKHKREESLLEIHQKKLKKKKKKEDKESKERRPFSRDVDLQVNRFDEAQKKSIIKKAQELNTRFGRGEAKYL